jgi:hypothetical protein
MAVLGGFYEDKKKSVLVIEKNKNYLQEFDDDVLDGYSFINQYDYFLIKKHEKGKQFDKLVRIEKDTLDVSIYNSNGHRLSIYSYPSTSKEVNNKSKVKEEIINKESKKEDVSIKKEVKTYYSKQEEKKEEKVIKQGYQKVNYANGRYEGKYSYDLRSGHGVFYFNNNDRVEGTWENDKMNGIGTLQDQQLKYIGRFVDDLFEGKGQLIDYKGNTYVGLFKKGKKCGIGNFILANGDTYEGEFVDDLYEGHGKLTTKDGDVYRGMFIKGMLNGNVLIEEKNKNRIYLGNFVDGVKDGKWIVNDKNGKKIKEEDWVKGIRKN